MTIDKKLGGLMVCAALSLLACSQEYSGGFGSETTNGVALQGSADSGATVAVRSITGTITDQQVYYDTVGDDGVWEIKVPKGGYLVELREDDLAGTENVVVLETDTVIDVGTVVVARPTRIRGKIVNATLTKKLATAAPAQKVVVYGLGLVTDVAADGSFEFDGVPVGKYVLGLQFNGKIQTEAMVEADDETVNAIDPGQTGIVLENFDDGDNNNLLGDFLAGGSWLNWLHRDKGDITGYLTTEDAYSGKSLRAVADTVDGDLLMILGSRGVEWEDGFDLGASDSVVFYAKGSGTVTFSVWARHAVCTGDWQRLEKPVVLTGKWTRYALAWRDLEYNGAPLGDIWSEWIVLKLTWKLPLKSELWLDDIQLPDLSPSELLNP